MKNVPRDFNWLPFFVKKKAFYRVFIDLFFPCRPSCVVKCHSEGFFFVIAFGFSKKERLETVVVTEFFFFTVTEFSLIDAVSGESRRRRVENEFIYFFFL